MRCGLAVRRLLVVILLGALPPGCVRLLHGGSDAARGERPPDRAAPELRALDRGAPERVRDASAERRSERGPVDLPRDLPPDVAGELGSYAFDFASPDLSAWTQVTNTWSVKNGVLAPGSAGFSEIQIPIVLDRSQGTLQMDARLPALDCRGAKLSLLDAGQSVLHVAIDHCSPTYGGTGATTRFRLGAAKGDAGEQGLPWTGDTSWHTLRVTFANGTYTFLLDGVVREVLPGPARLKASLLALGGWVHLPPGTEYDNVGIGP